MSKNRRNNNDIRLIQGLRTLIFKAAGSIAPEDTLKFLQFIFPEHREISSQSSLPKNILQIIDKAEYRKTHIGPVTKLKNDILLQVENSVGKNFIIQNSKFTYKLSKKLQSTKRKLEGTEIYETPPPKKKGQKIISYGHVKI